MTEVKAFHLGLTRSDIKGATVALIPGDPERVPKIATYFENSCKIASHREFNSYYGEVKGRPILAVSTGIGGPSTSICVEELAKIGVKYFIRIGTTGAIQPHINVGDIIITNAAVRLDGASDHFAPPEYPAVSDFEVTRAIAEAARELGARHHVGVTVSSATFYPGQERYDTYSGKVIRRFKGSLEEWQSFGILNYEMEAGTLFTMASTMGLKSGCVSGVIVNRTKTERVNEADIKLTEESTIKIGIEAAIKLLEKA
jgi:uridine phosphorylase